MSLALKGLSLSSKSALRSFNGVQRQGHSTSAVLMSSLSESMVELIIADDGEVSSAIRILAEKRNARIVTKSRKEAKDATGDTGPSGGSYLWSLHKITRDSEELPYSKAMLGDAVQMDCHVIEEMYIGRDKLSNDDTVQKWNDLLDRRKNLFTVIDTGNLDVPKMGDGGKYQNELDVALLAVQRASFLSRSLQLSLLKDRKSNDGVAVSKEDNSPVTVADFAVQALVLEAIRAAFPDDLVIAEEDSEMLQASKSVGQGVLAAVRTYATDFSLEQLCETVDRGGYDPDPGYADGLGSDRDRKTLPTDPEERVWVLDPVDGTKGFMRGQHYCIAMALMVGGKPVMSVLGCPNVNARRVLQGGLDDGGAVIDVSEIDSALLCSVDDLEMHVHPASSGSIFFAVDGRGAFIRSLADAPGAAYEANVCSSPSSAVTCDSSSSNVEAARGSGSIGDEWSGVVLCESVEAGHGDRQVTKAVAEVLGLRRDFVRMDGQCKYGIVGAGAAHGLMRLPPRGYVEKIWDHVPGELFVREAGGTVTCLDGRELDFAAHGRYLPREVQGIVASCGGLDENAEGGKEVHQQLLKQINEARGPTEIADKRVFLD